MPAHVPRAAVAASLFVLAACTDPAPTEPIGRTEHDLLFERPVDGVPRLAQISLDGGAPEAPAPTLVARAPVPTPGGGWVTYVVENAETYDTDLWIARRDGSEARRLTDHPEIDDHAAWSPHGTRLAFRSWRAGGEGDIWVMDADGSSLMNLTPDPLPRVTMEMRPAWSPDGLRIAFASNRGGDMDIWTMNADGTDWRRITSSPDFDTEPSWSPDGRWIAFRRSAPEVGSDIMIVSASGGEPRRIALPGEQRLPSWAPIAPLIAFVHQHRFQTGELAPPEVHTMRPDGTERRSRALGTSPGWIPR